MIGIVTGAFDLLHAGHINLFYEASKRCDELIVAVHVDPSIERKDKNRPVESVWERLAKIKACKYVDSVIVYEFESDLRSIFKFYKVDIRFLGSDYKDNKKPITDPDSIPIEYIESVPIHTSEIRKRME